MTKKALFWPENSLPMALDSLIDTLLTLALGALGALGGALILWKLYALPKINRWIIEQGSAKIREWMHAVVEDPAGEQAQQVGKLTGVAFSYALQGFEELVSTKDGRERLAPFLDVIQTHITQSIFASWGHILNKLREEGGAMNLGETGIPPEFLAFGDKLLPKKITEAGIGVKDILGMASWLSQFKGNGSGQSSLPMALGGASSARGSGSYNLR